jgi:hypothetical protein
MTGWGTPLIPKVIASANNALALSIGDLFWITLLAGVLGLACTLMLRDLRLRHFAQAGPAAEAAPGEAATQPRLSSGA